MGSGRSFVAGVMIVIAIVGIVVGVMYLVVPSHSLPSFFPGHIASGVYADAKHTKRGYVALGVGVVVLIAAVVLLSTGRRRRFRRRY